MPMTPSEDIAGQKCEDCGGEATHWYAGSAICCECHMEWVASLPAPEYSEEEIRAMVEYDVAHSPSDDILSPEDHKALNDLGEDLVDRLLKRQADSESMTKAHREWEEDF